MTSSDETSEDGFRSEFPKGSHRFALPEGRSPSLSIVEELAACLGRSPTGIEPLHDGVDPEALDRIVSETDRMKLRFVSNDVEVTVYGDGTVVLESTTE